jgi:aryl-alcohol dehydrogenase-like predicted oxidoreductase
MISRLALGTVQFGLQYGIANQAGRVSSAEAARIIKRASFNGLDTLDTAIAYGDSESTLGQIGVAKWRVVTKLPALPRECADIDGWVFSQIEGSLQRLGIDHLLAVLLHQPDQLLDKNGQQLCKALERLKQEGLTQKIGVSVYSPDELGTLFDHMNLDFIQAPLNILDRRMVDSGWAQRLKDKGVEFHARSIFLQGLLLMPGDQRPQKFARWDAVWSEWARWLDAVKITPVEACLRYALSVEAVDRVVVGIDSVAQLDEILAAVGGTLNSQPQWPQCVDTDLLNPARWNLL